MLLILSVLLPAFVASVVAVWFIYTEQRQAQEKGLAEAARALTLLVDNELSNSESMLHTLAESPIMERGDLKALYDHAKRLAPGQETAIILSDKDGRQLFNTRMPFGAPAPAVLQPIQEQRLRAGKDKTLVSDLFITPLSRQYDFLVQIPVSINGKAEFYLSRSMAATSLNPLLVQQGFPQSWIGTIVDRNAVVITRTQDAEKFIGRQASGSLKEKIIRRLPSGINQSKTLNGIPVFAFFYRAPMSEWTVILSVPQSELHQPAIQAAMLLTVLMAVLMLAALMVARRYSTRTITPIRQLEQNAKRLARHEEVRHVASGIVEIDAANTALSLASEEIRKNNAELERRIAEAVTSAKRAQQVLLQAQKLEALGRLTGGIAHDFNNVLQTLTISLQLIRLAPDKEKIFSLTGVCERAIARATTLISQLRAFGRAQEASLETIDPAKAIEEGLPLLKNVLPSNIELALSVEPQLWSVTIDPTQFELALMNLVINARDAIPNGGKIAVSARNEILTQEKANLHPGEYVRITVSDTGIGMAPEVLEKALEPFFTTKPVDKGTGLGLPQAYGFALQAKGDLEIESAEGQGTVVTIFLPRAFTQADLREANEKSPMLSTGTETILFVEDDELVRETITSLLRHAGFAVITAKNGSEALSILDNGATVDIVFSDIVMPGRMSGIELARQVKQRFAGIAVVLATGYSENEVDIPGVQVLAKPYEASELIMVLKDALGTIHADTK